MTFSADMARFIEKVRRRGDALFVNTASAVHASITAGSEVTGAPGQPVDKGYLITSWTLTFNGHTADVTTPANYAQDMEDNPRGVTLRSEVGGHGSVRLTRAGWPAIVEFEARALGAPE
jgi:hypothetical protein